MRNLYFIGISLLYLGIAQELTARSDALTPHAATQIQGQTSHTHDSGHTNVASISDKKPSLLTSKGDSISTESGGKVDFVDGKWTLTGVDVSTLPDPKVQLVTHGGELISTEVKPGEKALLKLDTKDMKLVAIQNGKAVTVPSGNFLHTASGSIILLNEKEAAVYDSKKQLVGKPYKATKTAGPLGKTSNPFAKVQLLSQHVQPTNDGNFVLKGVELSSQAEKPKSEAPSHATTEGSSTPKLRRRLGEDDAARHHDRSDAAIVGDSHWIDKSATLHVNPSSSAQTSASEHHDLTHEEKEKKEKEKEKEKVKEKEKEADKHEKHDDAKLLEDDSKKLSSKDVDKIKDLEKKATEEEKLALEERQKAAEIGKKLPAEKAEIINSKGIADKRKLEAEGDLARANKASSSFLKNHSQFKTLEKDLRDFREAKDRHAEWVAESARLKTELKVSEGKEGRAWEKRRQNAKHALEQADRELTRARQSVVYNEKKVNKAEEEAKKDGQYNKFHSLMLDVDKTSKEANDAKSKADISKKKVDHLIDNEKDSDSKKMMKEQQSKLKNADKHIKEAVDHRNEIFNIKANAKSK